MGSVQNVSVLGIEIKETSRCCKIPCGGRTGKYMKAGEENGGENNMSTACLKTSQSALTA